MQPVPIDQVENSKLQQKNNNGNKPGYTVHGDILEEINHSASKR